MRLLEERLEQVCFREVLRLREQLVSEKEAEAEQRQQDLNPTSSGEQQQLLQSYD